MELPLILDVYTDLIILAITIPYSPQIAENFDMPFFEVSCKQNINIEDAFLTLARKIREQREHRGENFDNDEKSAQDKRAGGGGSGGSNGLGPFTLGGSNNDTTGRCTC